MEGCTRTQCQRNGEKGETGNGRHAQEFQWRLLLMFETCEYIMWVKIKVYNVWRLNLQENHRHTIAIKYILRGMAMYRWIEVFYSYS